MKYILRSLIIVASLACVSLGARIHYLRRSAAFHQGEARRYAQMIGTHRNITPLEVDLALEEAAANPDDLRLDYKFNAVFHHRAAAAAYQEAVYHPWTLVHEPPPPVRRYDD